MSTLHLTNWVKQGEKTSPQTVSKRNGSKVSRDKKKQKAKEDDEDWRELYEAYVAQHGEEMEKLLLRIPQPFTLMCSELKVANYHREYIAEYLVQHGWDVKHIE
ncbi:MAG: hypothetical protein ACXV2D_07480 [Halobacteriota archaeon]